MKINIVFNPHLNAEKKKKIEFPYFVGFYTSIIPINFNINSNTRKSKVNDGKDNIIIYHDLKRETRSQLMLGSCTLHF